MLPGVTTAAGLLVVVLVALAAARSGGILGAPPGPRRTRRRRLPDGTSIPARPHHGRRAALYGVRLGAAVAMVALAIELGISVQAAARLDSGTNLLREAASVLGQDPGGWTTTRVAHATALAAEAADDLDAAQQRLGSDPFLEALGALPVAGPNARAARDLAAAAAAGSKAMSDSLAVAGSVVASRRAAAPAGPRLLELVSSSAARWRHAYAALAPAVAALQRDSGDPLLPPLRQQVGRALDVLSPAASLAQLGALAGDYAPTALGADGPRTYLLLLANPSEIRPAGGFVGSLGTVVFNGGAPVSLHVKAQEFYNSLIANPVPVPAPLDRYLKFYKNALEIGDAGWDPDFPTTARLSEQLFTSATKTPVDGTVSIDPYAVSQLLTVTGPVTVAGYGTFDSGNFFSRLNAIVNGNPDPVVGKQALAPISQAVLRDVLAVPSASWPRLFAVFKRAADERHIQVYAHDPRLAAAAARAHYDGSLLGGRGDYLMVADANVGATKGDAFAHRSMDVLTEVRAPGMALHQVVLDYSMPAVSSRLDHALNPGDGSYRDYVRLYLPADANVLAVAESLDGKAEPAGLDAITVAHGLQAVGAFLRVPDGHRAELVVTYEVPVNPASNYSLYLQKEAGVASVPTALTVSYPGGVSHESVSLARDAQVSVRW